MPFPSVVVASLGEARKRKAREGQEFTRAEKSPQKGNAALAAEVSREQPKPNHEPEGRHAREGHELTRAKPTRKKRNTASAAAKNGRSRTENSKARHAREGHEFTRAVKPEKMKPGFSR